MASKMIIMIQNLSLQIQKVIILYMSGRGWTHHGVVTGLPLLYNTFMIPSVVTFA